MEATILVHGVIRTALTASALLTHQPSCPGMLRACAGSTFRRDGALRFVKSSTSVFYSHGRMLHCRCSPSTLRCTACEAPLVAPCIGTLMG